jgi:hypothetical protein
MKTKPLAVIGGISVALLAACGGGGGGSVTPQSPGKVSASLADSPACGYDHVFVTVVSYGINAQADGSGAWTDVTLPAPKKIDLLSLTNGALESLGETALPAGTYQQLRLVLQPNAGNSAPFSNSVVPSGQTA